MRRIILFISILAMSVLAMAQVPQKMNFQALIHDNDNNLVKNRSVSLTVTVTNISNDVFYSEQQSVTTNHNGVATMIIGEGKPIIGSFSDIDWSADTYYLQTSIDLGDGSTILDGVSPLLSVPYALYADKAGYTNVDLTDYAKKTDLPTPVDLSVYALKSEIPAEVDLSDYAKKGDIPEPVDLSGYALKSEIPAKTDFIKDDEIDEFLDMTDYALKSEIPAEVSMVGYAKKSDIPQPVDMSVYAVKSDVSFLANYYSKSEVTEKVNEIQCALTGPIPPSVRTEQEVTVLYNTANIYGFVTAENGATISECGVCWGTSSNPTISNNKKISDKIGLGRYDVMLTSLAHNKTYYARAYAVNSAGVAYGETVKFTTEELKVPTVEVSDLRVTEDYVSLRVTVTAENGAMVTEPGLCWSTSENPTIADSKIILTSDNYNPVIGNYFVLLENLPEKTTYYARAYAINAAGVGYGEVFTFKTPTKLTSPTIETLIATEICSNAATVGGNVISSSGIPITECGVYWGTSENPTVGGGKIKTELIGWTGKYSISLSSLQPRTTYYVQAYAINSVGTGYGDVISFTTTEELPPVVHTEGFSNTSYSTVKVSGTMYGSDVTECGFCWATTKDPMIEMQHEYKAMETIEKTFSDILTGLEENTTYYVRAYAKNNIGIGYGESVSFTTLSTVSTLGVDSVTKNSAIVEGFIHADSYTNNCNDIKERGVCYVTSSDSNIPTIEHIKVRDRQKTCDGYKIKLDELKSSQKYYARAYVIYGKGISYGDIYSFETEEDIPVVVTMSVTSVTATSAIVKCKLNADNVTERGLCWGTNENPDIEDNIIIDNSGTNSFNVSLNSLVGATTYYVRAYAINEEGVNYGDVIAFTTLPPGMLKGEFSVSGTKKVNFSQGNLQYRPTNVSWRFAEQQYEIIGENNNFQIRSGAATYPDWIDLFTWGSSGYKGRYTHKGYDYDIQEEEAWVHEVNFDISGTNYDWGVYNGISNGGNKPGLWRALTDDEWEYLLHTRSSASSKYGVAMVNGVSGIVLLPDKWTLPQGVTFTSGVANASGEEYYQTVNNYTTEQWEKMENAGAVFLPAAGYLSMGHNGYGYVGTVKDKEKGYYWSSSCYSEDDGYEYTYETDPSMLYITSSLVSVFSRGSYMGFSVRLVRDVK